MVFGVSVMLLGVVMWIGWLGFCCDLVFCECLGDWVVFVWVVLFGGCWFGVWWLVFGV